MPDLTVLIPGIMGSRLRLAAAAGDRLLWHEDALNSLEGLLGNPALIQLGSGDGVEPDGVLVEMELWPGGISKSFYGLMRRKLCDRAEKDGGRYEEFSYDWRKSLFETAEALGGWLSDALGYVSDAEGRQQPAGRRELNIVGHSMGGLVAAIALMEGYVNPENVRRLVCIGTPFLGAPAAFRALYEGGPVPFYPWVDMWVNKGKNKKARRDALKAAMQSFPSVYQLLPHVAANYVRIVGNGHVNPLRQNVVPGPHVEAALEAHRCLAGLAGFVEEQLGGMCSVIQAETSRRSFFPRPDDTEHDFKARIGGTLAGSATYERVRVRTRTIGDGTVPAYSSTLGVSTPPHRVVGVEHGTMCDREEVVDLVMGALA